MGRLSAAGPSPTHPVDEAPLAREHGIGAEELGEHGIGARELGEHGVGAEELEVLRAVAEIIVPATVVPASTDRPAAGEDGAHLRVAQSLEMLQRGSVTLLGRLLNMYARAQRRGARFLDLDTAGRERALRALAEDDLDELCDLIEGLHAFTLGAHLAAWGGQLDRPAPPAWAAMGFHGPARGHLLLAAGRPAAAPERGGTSERGGAGNA